jgi:hypothetical protein
VLQDLLRDFEAATEVDQGVAGYDRAHALDPEHEVIVRPSGERLDADWSSLTRPAARANTARLGAKTRTRDRGCCSHR